MSDIIQEVQGHIDRAASEGHAPGVKAWTAVKDRLEGRPGITDASLAKWLAASQEKGWKSGMETLPKVQAALADEQDMLDQLSTVAEEPEPVAQTIPIKPKPVSESDIQEAYTSVCGNCGRTVVGPPPRTEEDVRDELEAALDSEDWDAVIVLAEELRG